MSTVAWTCLDAATWLWYSCCTSATCSVYCWFVHSSIFWSTIFLDSFEPIKVASDVSSSYFCFVISQSFCSTWFYFTKFCYSANIDSCRFVWVYHGYCRFLLHHRAYSYKLLWFERQILWFFKKPIHLPCTCLCLIDFIELWLDSVLGTFFHWKIVLDWHLSDYSIAILSTLIHHADLCEYTTVIVVQNVEILAPYSTIL